MQYAITIKYTDNIEKAGKLSVKDSKGNVVLDNVPVAIPDNVTTVNVSSLRMSYVTSAQNLLNFDSHGDYRNHVAKMTSQNRDQLIVNTADNVVFVSNMRVEQMSGAHELKNLVKDNKSFVLHNDDFKKLSKIISFNNSFTLEAKQVSFLWFPEKVNIKKTDVNQEYAVYKNKTQQLANLRDASFAKEDMSKPVLTKPSLEKPTTKPNLKPTLNKSTSVNNKVSSSSKNYRSSNSTNNIDDDDLDPLDVIFMYNNPELAPIYKPNSMLAWYMYFSHNEISNSTIKEDLQNILGFENVTDANVKYTANGYVVDLYDNGNSIGTMHYNNGDRTYHLESPAGDKTKLEIGDNGIIHGNVILSNDSKTNFSFIEKEDGFVGNWNNVSSQGIEISSGMQINSDYETTSNLNKTIDLNRVIDNSYNNDLDYVPPNNDTIEWSSTSDPYSNSLSL